jgi:hypothetical protein
MASIRLSYRALQDGDVQHGLIVDDANKLYGFARTNGAQTALIALNRDNAGHTATFSGLGAAPYNLPNGTVLVDALGGGTYTVSGGQVSVTVNSNWGVVLLEQNKVETPAAAAGLSKTTSGANVVLSWKPVISDTGSGRELAASYEIHRGTSATFTPGTSTRIATISAPAFGGTSSGSITYTDLNAAGQGYYYKIRAFNAPGKYSTSAGF